MSILAKRLKNLRLQKKLSLIEISRKVNLSRDALEAYEQGKRIPDISHVIKLTEFYEVSLCYLIGKTDNPTEIIDISDEFEGFHINGIQDLSEEEITKIALMASDDSLYMEWYLANTETEEPNNFIKD
ncbi:helix-turn-helix domain-containing protein [Pseudobacillus sp. 179-B 2D1 NHS]|uniref:helix-turn-helix domain-containing protein n=1 Tax=Pseudobacillus sp. 179-B 2D1 NHS TaxID=3374292 RepID=UPI003879562B